MNWSRRTRPKARFSHAGRLPAAACSAASSARWPRTRGHRFMSSGEIVIGSADAYQATLRDAGKVVAGFAERRAMIESALKMEAQKRKAGLGDCADLLDEVTALVEHPGGS